MVDFKALKKNRGKNLERLNEKVAQMASGGRRQEDERFWEPSIDKGNNGFAIVRFVGPPPGEEDEFVRYWDHGFKGPTGRWYINLSRTTIGEDDPVGAFNSQLWNSGNEEDKKQARAQKRRLKYVTNVYVIQDKAKPECEGKVFLYRFGPKIFDKLNGAMHPEFEDETPINPWDLWSGADFAIKVRDVEGYRNYDKSEFYRPGPLQINGRDGTDEQYEELWKTCHGLFEFIDPSKFKSYEELEKELNRVLGSKSEDERPARREEQRDPRRQEESRGRREDEGRSRRSESSEDDDPPFDLDEPKKRTERSSSDEEEADPDIEMFNRIAKRRKG